MRKRQTLDGSAMVQGLTGQVAMALALGLLLVTPALAQGLRDPDADYLRRFEGQARHVLVLEYVDRDSRASRDSGCLKARWRSSQDKGHRSRCPA